MTGSIGRKTADSMQFWTREEFDTFIEVIDDKPDTRVAFSLLFYSGMRVGELLALTLSDFDLEAKHRQHYQELLKIKQTGHHIRAKDT